nr:hypothetical protein [Mucor hiemalis f. corticola]
MQQRDYYPRQHKADEPNTLKYVWDETNKIQEAINSVPELEKIIVSGHICLDRLTQRKKDFGRGSQGRKILIQLGLSIIVMSQIADNIVKQVGKDNDSVIEEVLQYAALETNSCLRPLFRLKTTAQLRMVCDVGRLMCDRDARLKGTIYKWLPVVFDDDTSCDSALSFLYGNCDLLGYLRRINDQAMSIIIGIKSREISYETPSVCFDRLHAQCGTLIDTISRFPCSIEQPELVRTRLGQIYGYGSSEIILLSREGFVTRRNLDNLSYVTISRVWADTYKTTEDLYDTVSNIFKNGGAMYIWSDIWSVRSGQYREEDIKNMGTIYSKSDYTYICLGENDEKMITFTEGLQAPVRLRNITATTWCSRMWTFQEMALANQLVVIINEMHCLLPRSSLTGEGCNYDFVCKLTAIKPNSISFPLARRLASGRVSTFERDYIESLRGVCTPCASGNFSDSDMSEMSIPVDLLIGAGSSEEEDSVCWLPKAFVPKIPILSRLLKVTQDNYANIKAGSYRIIDRFDGGGIVVSVKPMLAGRACNILILARSISQKGVWHLVKSYLSKGSGLREHRLGDIGLSDLRIGARKKKRGASVNTTVKNNRSNEAKEMRSFSDILAQTSSKVFREHLVKQNETLQCDVLAEILANGRDTFVHDMTVFIDLKRLAFCVEEEIDNYQAYLEAMHGRVVNIALNDNASDDISALADILAGTILLSRSSSCVALCLLLGCSSSALSRNPRLEISKLGNILNPVEVFSQFYDSVAALENPSLQVSSVSEDVEVSNKTYRAEGSHCAPAESRPKYYPTTIGEEDVQQCGFAQCLIESGETMCIEGCTSERRTKLDYPLYIKQHVLRQWSGSSIILWRNERPSRCGHVDNSTTSPISRITNAHSLALKIGRMVSEAQRRQVAKHKTTESRAAKACFGRHKPTMFGSSNSKRSRLFRNTSSRPKRVGFKAMGKRLDVGYEHDVFSIKNYKYYMIWTSASLAKIMHSRRPNLKRRIRLKTFTESLK